MAKVTVHGGGVNALAPGEVEAVADTEKRKTKARAAAARKGLRDKAKNEEGVASSPGSSSSTPTEKPETGSEKPKPGGRSRARTTEPSSSKGRAGSGIAGSTDGSGEAD